MSDKPLLSGHGAGSGKEQKDTVKNMAMVAFAGTDRSLANKEAEVEDVSCGDLLGARNTSSADSPQNRGRHFNHYYSTSRSYNKARAEKVFR